MNPVATLGIVAALNTRQWELAKLIGAYGIGNAEAIVLAQAASPQRPHLSQCLAMIENESGGLNVFGSEGTACPVEWYDREVNHARYTVYRERRDAGGSPNGVGPTQITDTALQVEAQRLGGCWVPQLNCDVGFHFLHGLMVDYGTEGGYRAYNGSGPAADAYAERAMRWEAIWHDRFVAHGLA
jgi:hypothetical protein